MNKYPETSGKIRISGNFPPEISELTTLTTSPTRNAVKRRISPSRARRPRRLWYCCVAYFWTSSVKVYNEYCGPMRPVRRFYRPSDTFVLCQTLLCHTTNPSCVHYIHRMPGLYIYWIHSNWTNSGRNGSGDARNFHWAEGYSVGVLGYEIPQWGPGVEPR